MKREKTVVDVKVSDDKKKEIFGSLLREHTTFGMGIERERKRQEDRVSIFVWGLREKERDRRIE